MRDAETPFKHPPPPCLSHLQVAGWLQQLPVGTHLLLTSRLNKVVPATRTEVASVAMAVTAEEEHSRNSE